MYCVHLEKDCVVMTLAARLRSVASESVPLIEVSDDLDEAASISAARIPRWTDGCAGGQLSRIP